jgi:hypothetical protein
LTFSYFLAVNENVLAAPVVEHNDFVAYGYRLIARTEIVEIKDVDNPVKIQINTETANPPGIYDKLIGMELGEIKDVIIPPELGFSFSDPTYGSYANVTLYFYDLTVFEINGVHITDLPTNGGITPGSFGYYFLRVVLGLIGAAAIVLLVYGGYKYYPRLFGKRCATCKQIAVGTCKKCGRVFCERCYSNGCPYCKSRTMLRFKS